MLKPYAYVILEKTEYKGWPLGAYQVIRQDHDFKIVYPFRNDVLERVLELYKDGHWDVLKNDTGEVLLEGKSTPVFDRYWITRLQNHGYVHHYAVAAVCEMRSLVAYRR